jgi:CubicO group peptidase (beta-lactamase class C family)
MKRISYLARLLFLVPIIVVLTFCSEDSPTNPEIDTRKLNEAFVQAGQIPGLKSLVVLKDNVILGEQYWRSGGSENPHDVRSVTKSVVGLLIGIAIDKGYLKSVDQTMGEFISPLAPGMSVDKKNITIRHLLTMSSGFSGNELANVSDYNNWIYSANQVQYLVNKQLAAVPGQRFNYDSAALHLLSVILTSATKMSTENFAKQYLFAPLEINFNYWEKDHQGFNNGAAGLNITPHDMVKIGQLINNRGTYNGKRIVSEEWIDQTAATQINTNNAQMYGPGYGFCLWIGQNNKGSYAFANGYGGQFIVVVPKLNLVVTATNEWSGVATSTANSNWSGTLRLIMDSIVQSFE